MSKSGRLKSYHHVWLACHPERSEEWLLSMLADGFHVHHVDGNHYNDAPGNLILVEGQDHMLVFHGWKMAKINLGTPEIVVLSGNATVGRKGGKMCLKTMTKGQRKQRAQHAARMRWAKRATACAP